MPATLDVTSNLPVSAQNDRYLNYRSCTEPFRIVRHQGRSEPRELAAAFGSTRRSISGLETAAKPHFAISAIVVRGIGRT
jgi:hypothetical protein